ncbi:MAG: RsmE family RNA methyltransferase, partial [Megasphaera lornae]
MRKIFTDFPLEARFELNGADARHVLVVLRHGVGDRIAVTDSTGTTYACRIDSIAGHSAVLTVEERLSCRTQETGKVVLAAGLLKNDKFEWLIQKATELGVH